MGSTRRAGAAVAAVLADPIFELLPLKNLPDQIPHLPAGARVSVTASPAKGIDATLDWAARLQADGFRAIPHLSARMIADRAELAESPRRAPASAGLTTPSSSVAMPTNPGEYLDGLSLLQAMTELGHPFETIGCPGLPAGPPGHPGRARWPRRSSTRRRTWHMSRPRWTSTRRPIAALGPRRAGPRASCPPVIVGVPGVADPQKLLSIAARIGVKDAKRFLVKNLRFVTGLAQSGRLLQADRLRRRTRAAARRSDGARVTGLHLYTFNAVEATEAWRQSMLEKVAA